MHKPLWAAVLRLRQELSLSAAAAFLGCVHFQVRDSLTVPQTHYIFLLGNAKRPLWMAPALQVKFDDLAYWSGAVFFCGCRPFCKKFLTH
jgi:hypothetical protein